MTAHSWWVTGQASRPTISWDLRQEEASSSGSQGRPASAKKSFASSLHVVEEEEAGLSMARSLKSRSKRMSSMASSLLYKLEVRQQTSCWFSHNRDLLEQIKRRK